VPWNSATPITAVREYRYEEAMLDFCSQLARTQMYKYEPTTTRGNHNTRPSTITAKTAGHWHSSRGCQDEDRGHASAAYSTKYSTQVQQQMQPGFEFSACGYYTLYETGCLISHGALWRPGAQAIPRPAGALPAATATQPRLSCVRACALQAAKKRQQPAPALDFLDQRIRGPAVGGAPTEEPRPDANANNARSQRPATEGNCNWQLACLVLLPVVLCVVVLEPPWLPTGISARAPVIHLVRVHKQIPVQTS
jgi:hypothetical protein